MIDRWSVYYERTVELIITVDMVHPYHCCTPVSCTGTQAVASPYRLDLVCALPPDDYSFWLTSAGGASPYAN